MITLKVDGETGAKTTIFNGYAIFRDVFFMLHIPINLRQQKKI